MATLTQQEEKNKRIALIVSIVLHILLALLFFYIVAWDAPDPTLDQLGGIEISYGTSELGSGDVHSQAEPNDSDNPEDSRPAATAPVTTPTPTPQPQPQVTAPAPQAERVVTTTQDAPVSVKEEVKPEPTPQPKEEVKKVDTRAVYPGKATSGSGNGKTGTSNSPTGSNNGDAPGTVGDKGNPLGKYPGKKSGNGGSGGGSLNMPGWRYDLEPRKDPYENITGRIVFRVRIDGEGNIENVQVVESNVSPQVVKWYRDEINKTSFSRTNDSGTSQGASGTITFILKSN